MNPNEFPPTPPQQSPVVDPYAPPSAQVAAPVYAVGPQAVLAERGSRLGAQLLDGLTGLPSALFLVFGATMIENESGGLPAVGIICVLLGVIGLIALLVINLRLLARQGQTLGKKWAKVRIVRSDGSPVSLGRVIGLRYIVSGLPGAIPVAGNIYSLVNVLFIFREDRRCIHDMIADTKVVVA